MPFSRNVLFPQGHLLRHHDVFFSSLSGLLLNSRDGSVALLSVVLDISSSVGDPGARAINHAIREHVRSRGRVHPDLCKPIF
jgi:hypothetical protein